MITFGSPELRGRSVSTLKTYCAYISDGVRYLTRRSTATYTYYYVVGDPVTETCVELITKDPLICGLPGQTRTYECSPEVPNGYYSVIPEPLVIGAENPLSNEAWRALVVGTLGDISTEAWILDDYEIVASLYDLNTSYASATKAQWRVEHSPTPTGYLKVWINAKWTPFGGALTVSALPPYEWSGGLINPTLSPGDPANMIYGAANDIAVPDESGSAGVEMVKYSYVEGYEPADLGSSGWPP